MFKISQLVLVALLSGQVSAKTFNVNLDSEPTTKREENIFYSFGQVPVSRTEYVNLRVTNDGTEDLTFGKSVISGIDFYADTDCPDVLKPGKHCVFQVSFQPLLAARYDATLTVNFTNGDIINLDVDGEGVRR